MTSKVLQNMINSKPSDFPLDKLQKELFEIRKESWRTGDFRKKTSFSPSVVSGYYGQCPRYWHYAFNGAVFNDPFRAQSQAAMANGTLSHGRIQDVYAKLPYDVKIEKEITHNDPPIRGFIDVELTIDGVTADGDVKTVNAHGFQYHKMSMKPSPNHVVQVLIYMKVRNLQHGFIHYESKDSHEELFFPVEMNAANEDYIEKLFEWMRIVHANSKEPLLPVRVFQKASPSCKYCPLSKQCWDDKHGQINIVRARELL